MENNSRGVMVTIAALLLSAGIGYFNIEEDLFSHPIKEYIFRSIDRNLYITYHHTATEDLTLKEISQYHVEQKGWPGIAYHFAIKSNGDVYQLQKIEEITYHSKGHNTESIAVALLGNYEINQVPDAVIKSAECLQNGLESSLNIIGVRAHRDVRSTLCPGTYAYKKLNHLFW